MRAIGRILALALVLLVAGLAHAEPQVQKFEEVERGFWLRSTMGISVAMINHFGEDSRESSLWPPGPVLAVEMGIDLGQFGSLHLALQGQQISGSRDMGSRASVPNDSNTIGFLAGGRFNLLTTKKTSWFLKAAVGYMLASPGIAELDDGLLVQAGAGVELATNLRHFFFGLEAAGQYLLANGGLGIMATPTLKYVF